MKKPLAIISLALLLEIAAVGQRSERFDESTRVSKLFSNLLARARAAGSLEYNGSCGFDTLVPDFPPVREPQKPYAQDPAEALDFVFSGDGRMVVSRESNGIIRVVQAGVQTDILHVRIGRLSFEKVSDPNEALNMVITAPEVESFVQTHSIQMLFNSQTAPLGLLPGPRKSSTPGVPSISGELRNITLAGALDFVLKTFPGFWLYQNCQDPDGRRIVYFDLFPVPGRIWTWDKATTSLPQ